jgi:hypothetical protein
MGKIIPIAGDFGERDFSFSSGAFKLPWKENIWDGEKLPVSQLDEIEIASEESVKKIGGTLGWGAVGGFMLGPLGLFAGLMVGGKKKEITFVAKFKDGRKLLATTDHKTYKQIIGAIF